MVEIVETRTGAGVEPVLEVMPVCCIKCFN